jgi:hypothetical protein
MRSNYEAIECQPINRPTMISINASWLLPQIQWWLLTFEGVDIVHREREDPDDNKKHKNPISLTVEEFMNEISKKLENGDEMITAGIGNAIVDKWHETMGAKYDEMTSRTS